MKRKHKIWIILASLLGILAVTTTTFVVKEIQLNVLIKKQKKLWNNLDKLQNDKFKQDYFWNSKIQEILDKNIVLNTFKENFPDVKRKINNLDVELKKYYEINTQIKGIEPVFIKYNKITEEIKSYINKNLSEKQFQKVKQTLEETEKITSKIIHTKPTKNKTIAQTAFLQNAFDKAKLHSIATEDNEYNYLEINESNLQKYMDEGFIFARLNDSEPTSDYTKYIYTYKDLQKYQMNRLTFVFTKNIPNVDAINWTLENNFEINKFSKNKITLKHLKLQNIKEIKELTFSHANELLTLDLPNVINVNIDSFNAEIPLVNVKAPKLKSVNSTTFGEIFLEVLIESNKDKLAIFNDVIVDGTRAKGNIVIPNNITTISSSAFLANHQLISIDLQNVVEIGNSAFLDNKNLTNFAAPKLKIIKNGALNSNESLKGIYAPNVDVFGTNAIKYSGITLENSTLPKQITENIFNSIKQGLAWKKDKTNNSTE
ncbi:leucine-rich repeat domain-containing protein [Mycoplasma zalophi]|uniref:leucine-rich repeat domain-containing protein n=1 Tax=Mycoplasma zalophi TaxID=191287 RepID=UPI0021CA1F60|nr:leucine-rich repeat domain-containing protein [Mycoplasma zalophi]MCU4117151.1 leucine-rich repeat domain-containing protein [Mycoplasma zalophi]